MTSVDFQRCPTCFEVYDRGDIVLRYHHRDEKICRICYQTYKDKHSHPKDPPTDITQINEENLPYQWSNEDAVKFLESVEELPKWWEKFEQFLKRRKAYLEEEQENQPSTKNEEDPSDFREFFRSIYQEKVKVFSKLLGVEYVPPPEEPPTLVLTPPQQATQQTTPQQGIPVESLDLTEIDLSDSEGDRPTSKKLSLLCKFVSFTKEGQTNEFKVNINSLASVCLLKIKINKERKLGGWGFIRLVQRGKELKNDQILESLNLSEEVPIFVIYRNTQENPNRGIVQEAVPPPSVHPPRPPPVPQLSIPQPQVTVIDADDEGEYDINYEGENDDIL